MYHRISKQVKKERKEEKKKNKEGWESKRETGNMKRWIEEMNEEWMNE